jgi:hypothetical protein
MQNLASWTRPPNIALFLAVEGEPVGTPALSRPLVPLDLSAIREQHAIIVSSTTHREEWGSSRPEFTVSYGPVDAASIQTQSYFGAVVSPDSVESAATARLIVPREPAGTQYGVARSVPGETARVLVVHIGGTPSSFSILSPSTMLVAKRAAPDASAISSAIEALREAWLAEDAAEDETTIFDRHLQAFVDQGMAALSYAYSWVVRAGHEDFAFIRRFLLGLGQVYDESTQSYRLWFLISCLSHSSLRVRDGAAVGLAAMGDERSAAALKRAAYRESHPELRRYLEGALQAVRDA